MLIERKFSDCLLKFNEVLAVLFWQYTIKSTANQFMVIFQLIKQREIRSIGISRNLAGFAAIKCSASNSVNSNDLRIKPKSKRMRMPNVEYLCTYLNVCLCKIFICASDRTKPHKRIYLCPLCAVRIWNIIYFTMTIIMMSARQLEN